MKGLGVGMILPNKFTTAGGGSIFWKMFLGFPKEDHSPGPYGGDASVRSHTPLKTLWKKSNVLVAEGGVEIEVLDLFYAFLAKIAPPTKTKKMLGCFYSQAESCTSPMNLVVIKTSISFEQ